MRLAALVAVTIGLATCASQGAEAPQILSSTPGGLEISAWCSGVADAACRQGVADVAQRHCRSSGRAAQYVRGSVVERSLFRGENVIFVYSCVR